MSATSSQRDGRTSGADAEVVVGLLSQQLDLYRRLRALASRQHDLVAARESAQLLSVLAERQQIVDRLSRLDVEIRPLRSRWPEVRSALTPQQQRSVGEIVAEVGRTLSEIIDADSADCETLTQLRDDTRQEMAALDTGRRANSAYAPGRVETSRFLDRTDE